MNRFFLLLVAVAFFAGSSLPCFAYLPPNAGPRASSGDYLNVIAQEGAYVWAPNRLPLSVYISDGSNVPGWQPSFKSLIVNAFDEWCKKSNGKLSWRQVNSPRQAQIVVGWTAQTRAMGGGFEAGQTQTTTISTRQGTSIESARISILTTNLGRPFPREELYRTCLHEVGHALGLQGHSNSAGDIMYPRLNPQQVPYLTARDSNTINRLYRGYAEAPQTIAQNDVPDGIQPFSGIQAEDQDEQLDAPPVSDGSRRSSGDAWRRPPQSYRSPQFQGSPQYQPEEEYQPDYEAQDEPQYAPQQYAPMPRGVQGLMGGPQGALLKQFAANFGQQMLRQALMRRYGF